MKNPKLQCGHIIAFLHEEALLCIRDFGHDGHCDSDRLRKVIQHANYDVIMNLQMVARAA